MLPELLEQIPKGVQTVQVGALDGLSRDSVRSLAPSKTDYRLFTRIRAGEEVVVARKKIFPLLQKKIDYLSRSDVSVIALLCTGEFPALSSKVPLVEPDRLLNGVVTALVREGEIGVLTPTEEQTAQVRKRWKKMGIQAHVEAADPYGDLDALKDAADKLAVRKPLLILMDCMGYTNQMKRIVRNRTGKPTLLSKNVLARTLAELA
jgi:protein AroM